jgi:hypothetical protein
MHFHLRITPLGNSRSINFGLVHHPNTALGENCRECIRMLACAPLPRFCLGRELPCDLGIFELSFREFFSGHFKTQDYFVLEKNSQKKTVFRSNFRDFTKGAKPSSSDFVW